MGLHSALYDHLTTDANVFAALGLSVYNQMAPATESPPYAVISRVSATHVETFDGPSGLVEARIQISVWATTPDQAEDVAELIRLALHGFKGLMGTELLDVRRIGAEGPVDLETMSGAGSDTHDYGRAYDFNIWHAEPVP